jgi:hypothetical protein
MATMRSRSNTARAPSITSRRTDDFQAARVLVALGGVGGERAGAMARTATASRAVERFVEAQRAATAACF